MPQDLDAAMYPGAAAQLAQLAVAGLVAAGAGLVMWSVWRRLGGGCVRSAAAGRELPSAAPGRLTAALLMMVLCLLLTMGLRQIWPHPDLRTRGLAVLLITLATTALAWWRVARREGAR